MILLLLQRYGGILAVLSALVLGVGWVHHRWVDEGEKITQGKWDREEVERKKAEQEAVTSANEKIAAQKKEDAVNERKAMQSYETNLTKISADNDHERATALQLRIPRAVCDRTTASAETTSAIGINAAGTGAAELPRDIERGLQNLAVSADLEIQKRDAKIIALQHWIRDHGFSD